MYQASIQHDTAGICCIGASCCIECIALLYRSALGALLYRSTLYQSDLGATQQRLFWILPRRSLVSVSETRAHPSRWHTR